MITQSSNPSVLYNRTEQLFIPPGYEGIRDVLVKLIRHISIASGAITKDGVV